LTVAFSMLISLVPLPLSMAEASKAASVPAASDLAQARAEAATMPAAPSEPLVVSCVQSSSLAGGDLMITYTVTSNQLPASLPDIPPTAVTETVAVLANFDALDDLNTLRDVALEVTLTPAAMCQDSSIPPMQSGDT
jgi:hypothetical protein